MSDTILKELLKEYEQKRLRAEYELERRKQTLYKLSPRLSSIEEELNQFAVTVAKNLVSSPSTSSISELEKKINALKKEKNDILRKLNVSKQDLLPIYDCDLCKDTAYIMVSKKSVLCNCLKQKLFDIQFNRSNISSIHKDTFENFNSSLYSDKPNKQYNSAISPRENIQIIKEISENFIKNFDDSNEKNLLFTGSTGLGKTFLSNCIANELLKLGKTVLYQTAPVMLDTILDYRFGKQNDFNFIDHILNVDFLIIDDLGAESLNSTKISELFNIINSRLLTRKS